MQGNTQYEMSSIGGSSKVTDADNTGAFGEVQPSHEDGVYEVIANENKMKSEPTLLPEAALNDSVVTVTQAMYQHIGLFRRMICVMSVFLLMLFLTALAGVVLAVLLTTGKESTNCSNDVQQVDPKEMKAENSELKEELNFTRHQLDQLKTLVGQMNAELRQQKDAIRNLTTLETSNATRGPPGSPGPSGLPGPPGRDGLRGQTGSKGEKGDAGSQGPRGPPGSQGPMGPMGPRGFNGTQGAMGPPGVKGSQGLTGPMGYNGSQGPPGPPGLEGPRGPPGYNASSSGGGAGVPGPPGQPGPQGRPGPGNLTLCQYKNKKEAAQTAGPTAFSRVILREDEHPGMKTVAATCSTEGAQSTFFWMDNLSQIQT